MLGQSNSKLNASSEAWFKLDVTRAHHITIHGQSPRNAFSRTLVFSYECASLRLASLCCGTLVKHCPVSRPSSCPFIFHNIPRDAKPNVCAGFSHRDVDPKVNQAPIVAGYPKGASSSECPASTSSSSCWRVNRNIMIDVSSQAEVRGAYLLQKLLAMRQLDTQAQRTYDRARIFLLLRLRRRTRFFLHLALILNDSRS